MGFTNPSIQAELGLGTTDFHAKLARAEKGVKQFEGGVGDLGKVFSGAGTLTAVGAFFGAIISAARDSKDELSENVQAVRAFGDSVTNLTEGAKEFGIGFLGSLNRIGEAAGTVFNGIKSFLSGTYNEFIIGENLVGQTARAAAEAARNLADANKHAAEFKAVTAGLARLEEQREAMARKALTVEERINVLRAEAYAAEQRANDQTATALERRQALLAQRTAELALVTEIEAHQKAMAAESAKAAEAERKAQLARLTNAEKVDYLTRELADLEGAIATGVLSAANNEQLRIRAKTVTLELTAAQAAAEQEAAKAAAKAADEKLKTAELIADYSEQDRLAKIDGLSTEDKIAALTREKLGLQESLTDETTDEETKREAITRLREIDKQLAAATLGVEKEITAEISRREKIKNAVREAEQKGLSIEYDSKGNPVRARGYGGLNLPLELFDRSQAIYFDPVEQQRFEQERVDSAIRQIDEQIATAQERVQVLQRSGASSGRYEIPELQAAIRTLYDRKSRARDYVFSPDYSDALGAGLVGQRNDFYGDPGTAGRIEEQAKVTNENLRTISDRLRRLTDPTFGA